MPNTIRTVPSRSMALAVGAVLLALTAPTVHAGPDDGPGIDPGAPGVSREQTPTPGLPPIQVSPNPAICYGDQTQTTADVTWTPYPWGPVRLAFDNVGGTQYVGSHPPTEPDDDPHAILDMPCGRTLRVYLEEPWPGTLVGPSVDVTTVKLDLVPPDPQPPRIDPTPMPEIQLPGVPR